MIRQKLPLRTGVGIIVLNKQNKIFVGKRKDNPGDKWQMPQGQNYHPIFRCIFFGYLPLIMV